MSIPFNTTKKNPWILYKTTNLINNKYYIGIHKIKKSKNLYLGSGKVLQYAIKKYGEENFKREVLDTFQSIHEARDAEAKAVNEDTIKDPLCYNLRPGGWGGTLPGVNHPCYGKELTEEHKEKVSQGLQRYNEEIDIHHNKGFIHTDETKEKMSISRTGEKNHFYGKRHSKKSCKKISKKVKKIMNNNYLAGDHPRARAVVQYDLDGNFIKEWETATEAEKETQARRTKIIAVCKGRRNKTAGFIWKYADEVL